MKPEIRRFAAVCGILGPLMLASYFTAPAILDWPYAGDSPTRLTAYALDHQTLFFAGAWLQITGTLLSVICLLAIVRLATNPGLAGTLVQVMSAVLVAVVLVEGALMVTVPGAAATGDGSTVATTFALSNGPFARVFPLAPASATYVALGLLILDSAVLHRWFGIVAIAMGIGFELMGTLAVFLSPALIAVAVLAPGQAIWIAAGAIALWRKE